MEQRYLFWANAGRLYNVLGRLPECENAIAHARAIFDDDPAVHLDLAQLRRLQGRIMEADAEFRQALAMEPLGPYWRAYGGFLQDQQRLDEAMECYRRSAADSLRPNEAWSELAQLALSAGKPKVALDAADRALASSPFQGDAAGIGTEFTAGMMGVRGQAFMAMLQADRAAEAYQQALGAGSKNPRRLQNLYLGLGEACFQAGRIPNAQNALKSADDLIQKTGPASQNIIARREHLEWLLKSKHNSP